ncbi:hypothetical protein CICLE_v10023156mg [Citrus x clementina]|uniref:Uncharacterized protein n=1 Tax=Citrus clementina TaxID=85681 RepID=V4VMW3_CITCL|nr:hypothetical protein CICLE_v10023156mg [Citrus x clementina]
MGRKTILCPKKKKKHLNPQWYTNAKIATHFHASKLLVGVCLVLLTYHLLKASNIRQPILCSTMTADKKPTPNPKHTLQ